jgi:hypothetical protein
MDEKLIIAFYLICPKCKTIFRGESYQVIDYPIEAYRKYPSICPACDVPLVPELNKQSPLD